MLTFKKNSIQYNLILSGARDFIVIAYEAPTNLGDQFQIKEYLSAPVWPFWYPSDRQMLCRITQVTLLSKPIAYSLKIVTFSIVEAMG